jgi:hypothetical protein
MIYYHYFLQCPNSHYIPVPPPILLETDGSPRKIPKENRKAAFVCPYRALVSAYSAQDIVRHQETGKESLFEANVCHLVAIQVECDGKNCEAPKVIHATQDAGKGTWNVRVAPKKWMFSDSARCGAGHKLHYEERSGLLLPAVVDLSLSFSVNS